MTDVAYRKKLIEVSLPLEAINVASAREKSIRHGHPSTLHLWWARRPLAACRAVLFASLVDDPDSDPTFRNADGSVDEERAGYRRAELFNLIEELVKWENSNNESVLNRARAEIAASVASRKILDTKEWKKDQIVCKEKAWQFVCRLAKPADVNAFLAEHAPSVLDPFCGGGSIPLEAQRLGLRVYASDLNPVSVLITKALIEIPPKFAGKPPVNPESNAKFKDGWKGAQGLAEDVRYYGKWIRDEAEKRIGHLYPKVKVTAEMAMDRPDLKYLVGDELPVVAWLWARTVASPNPALQGAQIPLIRSFWLSTKKGREVYLRPRISTNRTSYSFDILSGMPPSDFDPRHGTVERGGGRCLLSDQPIPFDYIRSQACAGLMGAQLLCLVLQAGRERIFVPADPAQIHAATDCIARDYPDSDLPKQALSMRVMLYGMDKHYKLFTQRQLVLLNQMTLILKEVGLRIAADAVSSCVQIDRSDYVTSVLSLLAFGISKMTTTNTTLATWQTDPTRLVAAFSRQAVPMVWDYAEANPFGSVAGDYELAIQSIVEVLERLPLHAMPGVVRQLNVMEARLVDRLVLVATDPPYYDNIGYSDLSDYFYVWLRRSLSESWPQLFATVLTPKSQELIATPYRFNGNKTAARQFFEDGLVQAFKNIRSVQSDFGPVTLFYAFKQSEGSDENDSEQFETVSTGWETMLEGLIQSGFSVTSTWPMRTELTGNLKKNLASLASSIVLSCRPRSIDASLATRREFLNALKGELPEAMKLLQHGNIAPVDLAQAAIGPGMAVFTRYAKVMESSGEPMKVRQALALINQTLDEVLAEQEGEFDADTRWALAWFEQFGMDEGAFGMAETLSKAKNTAVNALVEAGIVQTRSGKVNLLKREELDPTWDPTTDKRLTAWEITQYLILMLEKQGEQAASDLLRKLGGTGPVARDLAYRLYNLCERKKWPQEALSYNSLVIAWPEISRLAQAKTAPARVSQGEMFT